MDQAQEPNTGTPERKRGNAGLLALVVLLLITNVVMLYMLMQKNDTVGQQQQQITAVSQEKEDVTAMLENMLSQYDTLNTENEELKTQMAASKEQIEELMQKVKNGNYSLAKAKKEADTLRRIMKGYVATIDSLNQANLQLTAEKAGLTQELGEEKGKTAALQTQSQEQADLIAKGSVLHTTTITAGALFVRDNGKQVDTDRAKKAEMIKSCFTLGENKVTKAGSKTLYMRIISPDGSILPTGDSNGRSTFNGMEGDFSAKRDVDYQNAPVDVCVFYQANDALKTGQYIVEIYEAGQSVSKTTFNLK